MASLFETLQKKLTEQDDPLAGGQQDKIAAALRAKSGKATAAATPGASNLGEQAAQSLGQAAVDQTAQQGQLLGTQIGQQATLQDQRLDAAKADLASQEQQGQANIATQQQVAAENLQAQQQGAIQGIQFNEALKTEQVITAADQQLRALASERNLSIDNVFRQFAREQKILANRKDQSRIEQVGFMLAMRDQAYMNELDRIGKERDLKDQLNYQDEMTRLVMGENLSLLLDDLDFKTALNADQRAWNEHLASMDLDAAISLASATLHDQNVAAQISGAGDVVKTGTTAYVQYKKDKAALPDKKDE
jgi:hypothetical protein